MRSLGVLLAIVLLGCAHEAGPAARHPDPPAERADADAPNEPATPPPDERVATPPDQPFVLTAGECTIEVGPIASFEELRGGYESAEWIARLPPEQREMAEGEDHFEAHGRCVLEVRVAGRQRRYLDVVTGFVVGGPAPSREQCLADRERVATHLLAMTDHCRDPDGRGVLTAP